MKNERDWFESGSQMPDFNPNKEKEIDTAERDLEVAHRVLGTKGSIKDNPLNDDKSDPLTVTELLLIRACKSNAGLPRVMSVYKRQYGLSYEDKEGLAAVLANLIDEHHPISTRELVYKVSPSNVMWWSGGDSVEYIDRTLTVLVSHLRMAEVAKFKGWKSPAWIRNMV